MVSAFLTVIQLFVRLLMYPLLVCGIVFGLFYLDCVFWFFWERYRHGARLQRDSVRQLPRRPVLVRLFWDAPRQYVRDVYNRPPDFFRPQGMIIFTGRQGGGKSSALMQYALDLKDSYPMAKCLSNTAFKYQDESLKHWTQLIRYKNAQKGVIVIMDELQNWFSSNQSRNFPPEMLSVITQNRKNRRIILGTAQNFYLLAKPIRSQCTEIRECITFAGVVTIVRRREPIIDNAGEVQQIKSRGMYFFVHTPRLREAYDTWAVVDNLGKSGFYDSPMGRDAGSINDLSFKN